MRVRIRRSDRVLAGSPDVWRPAFGNDDCRVKRRRVASAPARRKTPWHQNLKESQETTAPRNGAQRTKSVEWVRPGAAARAQLAAALFCIRNTSPKRQRGRNNNERQLTHLPRSRFGLVNECSAQKSQRRAQHLWANGPAYIGQGQRPWKTKRQINLLQAL